MDKRDQPRAVSAKMEADRATSSRRETPPQQAYFSTLHAAIYLDVSPKILEHWRARGGGPPYAKIGRHVRYSRQLLDGWVEQRTRSNTSQESAQ